MKGRGWIALGGMVVLVFLLVLLRMVLRIPWLAAVAWCVLVSGPLEGEPFVSGLVRAALLLLVLPWPAPVAARYPRHR